VPKKVTRIERRGSGTFASELKSEKTPAEKKKVKKPCGRRYVGSHGTTLRTKGNYSCKLPGGKKGKAVHRD